MDEFDIITNRNKSGDDLLNINNSQSNGSNNNGNYLIYDNQINNFN